MEWVLYVDMDAFYVSCELLRYPGLRGRPVIVGHRPSNGPTRAVVLSASYEARAFGVRSAQPVAEAARRCPDAEWLPPDFSQYESTSRRVQEWLGSRFSSVVPHSIDEASVRTSAEDVEAAIAGARDAQQALLHALNLPSSWGVATTRLIAKIASDRAKPGGVVGVTPTQTAAFLAPLPVRVIPGVGPKTAEILGRAGIETVGDLAQRRSSELRDRLGPWGSTLVSIARGTPPADSEESSGPRSRSTDRTFDVDQSDRSVIEAEVERLSVDLAASLEKEGTSYRGVGVAVRWADFDRVQRTRSLSGATTGPNGLVAQARRLVRELLQEERAGRDRAVRTVTVRADRIGPASSAQERLDRY